MTTKKIYEPWIKWDGGECPVPPDASVEVNFRCGIIKQVAPAKNYRWSHDGDCLDIVEYRIVIEQADLNAAEKLLFSYGYTIIPPAKPLTFEDVAPLTEVPPEGTEYWAISPTVDEGAYRALINGSGVDYRVVKRRMAYLDKEHALIAAQHIFGLKGGEL